MNVLIKADCGCLFSSSFQTPFKDVGTVQLELWRQLRGMAIGAGTNKQKRLSEKRLACTARTGSPGYDCEDTYAPS